MANRKLIVQIVGDSRSLERAFTRSSRSAKGFNVAMSGVVRGTGGFSRGFLSGAGALSTFGGALALTSGSFFAGAGIVAGLKASVGAAGEFEQTLDVLRQVTGATGEEMKRASVLAQQLGADISLPATSASDAATALLQLSKGGLALNDAMASSRATLQLAAAAQTDVASAANITARAVTAFGLAGSDAVGVIDALANGAQSATGDISDYAIALSQSSTVANQFGLTAQDTVTAITSLAKAGLIGSDAGTSLRVMLSRLLPTTARAKAEMQKLGVSVTDAKGEFLPFRQVVERYSEVLRKLTPAQKQMSLQVIFGQDAQRAANIILSQSVSTYDSLSAAVARQGGAQRAAAAQQKGYKGAVDAFNSALETTQVTIGQVMIPTLTRYLRRLAAFLGTTKNQEAIQRKFKSVLEGTIDTIRTIGDVIGGVSGKLGGWENSLRLVVGAFIGFKIVGVASAVAVGTANVLAAGVTASAWKAALISTGFGAFAVAAGIAATYVITHWSKVKDFFEKLWITLKAGAYRAALGIVEPFSHLPSKLGEDAREAKESILAGLEGLREDFAAIGQDSGAALAQGIIVGYIDNQPIFGKNLPQPLTGLVGPPGFEKRLGGVDAVARAGAAGAGISSGTGITAEQRNKWFDAAIGRSQSRVQDITKMEGQVRELERIAGLITERIKVTKDITRRLNLEDDLLQVRREIRATRSRIVEAAKARTAEAVKLREEAERQLKERRKAAELARSAAQFKTLGFGPTGGDLVPNVQSLKKSLGSVADAIKGSFLDTGKTRSVLANIRKVLAGGLGKVSAEVRAKVKELLDGIDQQLKDHAGRNLTRGKAVDTSKILAGLGLTPDQLRELRGRVSQISSSGRVPNRGTGAFGIGFSQQPVVVHTTVNLDGKKVASNTTRHQQKRARQTVSQRGGRNAGVALGLG